MRNRAHGVIALLAVLFWLTAAGLAQNAAAPAQSAATSDEKRTLEALLVEVRLLREALERINLNTHRSQLVIERMRVQSERVSQISRQLDNARSSLLDMRTSIAQMEERGNNFEQQVQQESDPQRRQQMEMELKSFKAVFKEQRQREAQLQEREQQLNNQLLVEQGKLDDLERRLELLEREIEQASQKGEAPKRR